MGMIDPAKLIREFLRMLTQQYRVALMALSTTEVAIEKTSHN